MTIRRAINRNLECDTSSIRSSSSGGGGGNVKNILFFICLFFKSNFKKVFKKLFKINIFFIFLDCFNVKNYF